MVFEYGHLSLQRAYVGNLSLQRAYVYVGGKLTRRLTIFRMRRLSNFTQRFVGYDVVLTRESVLC